VIARAVAALCRFFEPVEPEHRRPFFNDPDMGI